MNVINLFDIDNGLTQLEQKISFGNYDLFTPKICRIDLDTERIFPPLEN